MVKKIITRKKKDPLLESPLVICFVLFFIVMLPFYWRFAYILYLDKFGIRTQGKVIYNEIVSCHGEKGFENRTCAHPVVKYTSNEESTTVFRGKYRLTSFEDYKSGSVVNIIVDPLRKDTGITIQGDELSLEYSAGFSAILVYLFVLCLVLLNNFLSRFVNFRYLKIDKITKWWF